MRDGAVGHPHLDDRAVVVPQEFRRPARRSNKKEKKRKQAIQAPKRRKVDKDSAFNSSKQRGANRKLCSQDSQLIGVIDVGLEGLDGVLKLAHRRVPPPPPPATPPSLLLGLRFRQYLPPAWRAESHEREVKQTLPKTFPAPLPDTRRLDFGLRRIGLERACLSGVRSRSGLDWIGFVSFF